MIFRNNAPKYWEKGLPAIPLHKWDTINDKGVSIGKAPCLNQWQRFNCYMPTYAEQQEWLAKYPDGNIGLPLGEQSRCVALDIDTDNPNELALIDRLVPKSPWARVGKKGKVLMFKYNGEKTFRIKDNTGRTICELLSSKTQVVLPPSIHPDTKQPYVANCNLYEVVDQLPLLPKGIEEVLRGALEEELGIKLSHMGWSRTIDYVSYGSRDVKMTSVAGVYAQAVIRGEVTLKEAIGMLRAWCATQVEPVAGDDVDVEKGVRNLVKFMLNAVKGPKKKALPRGWDTDLTLEEKKQLSIVVDEDCMSWTYDTVRQYLQEAMEKYPINTPERNTAIEYIVERIARSNLSVIEEERCLKLLVQTNNDITLPSLRKRIRELRSNGMDGVNHTEIARAVLKDLNEIIPDTETYDTTREFNSIRYFSSKFWRWGGSHWEQLPEIDILKAISTEYGNLPAATRNSDHLGILNIMKSQVAQQICDVETRGVNFANGYVDINGNLLKHSRKYGCTYTLPYSYRPELSDLNNSPKFKAFLKSVWGDEPDFKERVTALQEAIAVTIFGYGPSFARAVLLYGIAKSGKSQLLRIIESLIPSEIISYVTPYDFSDKFKPASLANSVLNICGELDENNPIPGAMFKQVIDGSEMEGQYKGKQLFKFRPKATHWFASNHLPKTKDATEGFNRRWLIFTFNKMVRAENQVRDIGNSIAAEERESISAWAISCMKKLHKQGDYTLPRSHIYMINEMAAENDSLFFFLASEEGPRLKKNSSIPTDKLYETYRSFCYAIAGARPVGLRKFYTRLKELGIIFGFSVGNLEVNGLTMEKGEGSRVVRAG